jgi:hypothetical protein
MGGLDQLLHAYRAQKAFERGLPRYCVFGDSVLRGIASARPKTMRALFEVKGMGPERCGKYGEDILRLVEQALAPVVVMRGRGVKLRSPLIAKKAPPGGEDVYILRLAEGRVYVGKSGDVPRRVAQHMGGAGSAFTKAFPPTGQFLPRLGDVRGGTDAAERDETLRYMFLCGVDRVRGWRYTQVLLSKADLEDAECNIRELYDLCRRCGRRGHFIGQCKHATDRLGRKL